MIEPQNTPFKPNGHGLGPIKRLWMFLVRQECIQNFFIKFIFGRKAKPVNFRYLSKSTKRRVEQPPWDLCILPVVLLYYHGYNRGIMYYLENIQHSVFFLVYYFLILLFFYRGMNTDVLHESASFISDANTAIAATGDEG